MGGGNGKNRNMYIFIDCFYKLSEVCMLSPEEEAEFKRINEEQKRKREDQHKRRVIESGRHGGRDVWFPLLCCGGGGVLMALANIDSYFTGFAGSNYKGNTLGLISGLILWTALPVIFGLVFSLYLRHRREKYGE
jgi:hypothetical protein